MELINMFKFSKHEIEQISEKINSNQNNFSINLTGLLFAIALNITWLIVTFSILLFFCIFIFINKKLHIFKIEKN
jgi:hypothetical protein